MSHSSMNSSRHSPAAAVLVALTLMVTAALAAPTPGSVPIPPLPAGQKPNIIFILIDDMGFDDFGFANPKYLTTPNMDKWLTEGTRFDNFYVGPQCAQTRSMFLTGRHHARVGTLLTNGGCDFIHPNETSIAQVMAAAGYTTAQYGKWHNSDVIGYTPLDVGFNTSYNPPLNLLWNGANLPKYPKGLVRKDNRYYLEPLQNGTKMEPAEFLNLQVLKYLMNQTDVQQAARDAGEDPTPFFLYYPLNAIHTARIYPDKFKQKFLGPNRDPKYNGVITNTLDCWAFAEYLDEVLGPLFKYINDTALRDNTIVMFGSDNGPDEHPGENFNFKIRLPSGAIGTKSSLYEGGIRTMFGVRGPGVQAGVVDSTLLQIEDLLPTFADLGGLSIKTVETRPLDGLSFKSLIWPDLGTNDVAVAKSVAGARTAIRREDDLATRQQKDRVVFRFGMVCWDPDAIAAVNADREVDRSQVLLNYAKGGMRNRWFKPHADQPGYRPGFQLCTVARHKDYKWHGSTNKVYRFNGSDHAETPQNEVTGIAAEKLRAMFEEEARKWWTSVVADDHSFVRASYVLGKLPIRVTNLNPATPLERTFARTYVDQFSIRGFRQPGDRACWGAEVLTAGIYEVVLIYSSTQEAKFKFAVDTFANIQANKGPRIITQLPVQKPELKGYVIGNILLPLSGTRKTEVCLELLSLTKPGLAVFTNLGAIRITLMKPENGNLLATGGLQHHTTGPSSTGLQDDELQSGLQVAAASNADPSAPQQEQTFDNVTQPKDTGDGMVAVDTSDDAEVTVAQPAAGLDITGEHSWLLDALPEDNSDLAMLANWTSIPEPEGDVSTAANQESGRTSGRRRRSKEQAQRDWHRLRRINGWPDGQGSLLEFMYSPFQQEDCAACRNIKI